MKKDNQKVKALLLSYLTIAVQIIINIFITPFLIKAMGINEYGLYETINSFGTTFLVINFGISAIVSRYIVKYKQKNDKRSLENFLYMSCIISFCIFILIILIGVIAINFIPQIYENSLDISQLDKAKYMFIFIIFNLAILSWHNFTNGIIIGSERFMFASISKLLKQIFKLIIIIFLIIFGVNATSVVICDLIVTIMIIIIEALYCWLKLHIKIKFYYFDFKMLKKIFSFSIASIIQTITNQINLSLDKVILGVMMTTEIVAKYSVGLLIINVLVTVMQIINGVYLPDATKLVLQKANGETMTNFVIKPSRFQFIIGCLAVFGFLLIGKDFLIIWVGNDFSEIWSSTLIILIFTTLSYITSIANVILDAMLKKIYRSLILIFTAILNVIITICLIPYLGYFGAALGTGFSLLIGNIILLNIYYKKQIKLKIKYMYLEIFKGILPSAILSFFISFFIRIFLKNIYLRIAIPVLMFISIFYLLLYFYGFNENEKILIKKMLKKFYSHNS